MKLTKEVLYQKYIVENQTASKIAMDYGFSKPKVRGLLRRNGIRKKEFKLGNNIYDDKEWLYTQYIILNKGYTVIANELGVGYTTILERILFFGWKVRGHKDIDKALPRIGKKHSETALMKIKKTRVKNRVTASCFFCKKVFERVNSDYVRSEKSFCSYQCFREHLKINRVETETITDSAEYKEWRIRVYKRDGYRCKMPNCYSNSRDIAAHHIFPKKKYPEKQFDLDNGITLCRKCHEKTFGKEEQFIDALVRIVQKMND